MLVPKLSVVFGAALMLASFTFQAPAAAALGGVGSTALGDVPVAPRAYPEKRAAAFRADIPAGVTSQAFSYGHRSPSAEIVAWYRARLPQAGWRIRRIERARSRFTVVLADRPGAAVNVLVEADRASSHVTLLRFATPR